MIKLGFIFYHSVFERTTNFNLTMRSFTIISLFLFSNWMIKAQSSQLVTDYLEAWKNFYPSKAVNLGLHQAIFNYEDFSTVKIRSWLAYNKKTLIEAEKASKNPHWNTRVNARLLRSQVRNEIDLWGAGISSDHVLKKYVELINDAVTNIVRADWLTEGERHTLLIERLNAVENLCQAVRQYVMDQENNDVSDHINSLETAMVFYEDSLPNKYSWLLDNEKGFLREGCRKAARGIESLIRFLKD